MSIENPEARYIEASAGESGPKTDEILEAQIETEAAALEGNIAETAEMLEKVDVMELPAENRKSLSTRAKFVMGALLLAAGLGGLAAFSGEKEGKSRISSGAVVSGISFLAGIQSLKAAVDKFEKGQGRKEDK